MKKTGKEVPCAACGKMSYKPAWQLARAKYYFCSYTCSNKFTSNLPDSYNKNKPDSACKKLSVALMGHVLSPKTKIALAKHAYKSGAKHPYWKGGIATLPWGPEFTTKLKAEIRARDGFKCQQCGIAEADLDKSVHKHLIIHHKDSNKNNNDPANLTTLCRSCHSVLHHPKETTEHCRYIYANSSTNQMKGASK